MTVFDIPTTELVESTFMLDDGTVSSPSARGTVMNVTQVYDPHFRLKLQSIPLDQAGMQMWTSWKAKMKGGLNAFTAIDISRRTPLNYQTARVPADIASGWAGTASVASLGLSGALGLSGLPAGYVAKAGDRVGIEQGGAIGLHEILDDATADGSGNLALTVHPFLYTSTFTTAAVARLWQPKGLFRIDWRSWQMSITARQSPITFEGFGVLR